MGVKHTMDNPVNTYMLSFNTTDKKLLTLENADIDAIAFEKIYQEYLIGRVFFVLKIFLIL